MPDLRPRRLAALLVLAPLLAAPLAGCGDDATTADDAAATTTTTEAATSSTVPAADVEDLTGQAEVAIDVVDNTFTPRYVRVRPGTKITFTNHGRNTHNVTPAATGSFTPIDGKDFAPGDTASIVVEDAGVLAYYCSIHGTPRNGQNGAFEVVPG